MRALDGGHEGTVKEAPVHAGAVEVRQPEHGALDAAGRMGLEQQVLLRLPHPALEGVRLARVVFAHPLG